MVPYLSSTILCLAVSIKDGVLIIGFNKLSLSNGQTDLGDEKVTWSKAIDSANIRIRLKSSKHLLEGLSRVSLTSISHMTMLRNFSLIILTGPCR